MKMLARARPEMEKTAIATIISMRVYATCGRWADLIDIVLHAVSGDIGAQRTVVIDSAGGSPLESDGELAHVGRVRGANRAVADRHSAVISYTLLIGAALGVIDIGESGGDIAGGGDLGPIVKADAFELFEHDLGGAGVFARQAHHEHAVIYGADDAAAHDGEDNGGNNDLNQGAGSLGFPSGRELVCCAAGFFSCGQAR